MSNKQTNPRPMVVSKRLGKTTRPRVPRLSDPPDGDEALRAWIRQLVKEITGLAQRLALVELKLANMQVDATTHALTFPPT